MSETKITKMVVQKEGRKLIFNPAGDIDLSQYYTKSEIDSKFNSYALKTEVPDTSNLATKTELNSVKSTATTANNTANSAKTTAQNALNTANSKLANIATNRFITHTEGSYNYVPTNYINKNIYVKHPCLMKISATTVTHDDDRSITLNGKEIFHVHYQKSANSHSYSGVNYTIPVYCGTSDAIKITGRYVTTRCIISFIAAGTNSFLYA